MSCFWVGLIKALHDLNLLKNITPIHFLKIIKIFNKKVSNVTCNGEKLTSKQKQENYDRIVEITTINDGYDCSGCDPVLILICHVYNIDITHKFNGTIINYAYTCNSNHTITIHSNKTHFWS